MSTQVDDALESPLKAMCETPTKSGIGYYVPRGSKFLCVVSYLPGFPGFYTARHDGGYNTFFLTTTIDVVRASGDTETSTIKWASKWFGSYVQWPGTTSFSNGQVETSRSRSNSLVAYSYPIVFGPDQFLFANDNGIGDSMTVSSDTFASGSFRDTILGVYVGNGSFTVTRSDPVSISDFIAAVDSYVAAYDMSTVALNKIHYEIYDTAQVGWDSNLGYLAPTDLLYGFLDSTVDSTVNFNTNSSKLIAAACYKIKPFGTDSSSRDYRCNIYLCLRGKVGDVFDNYAIKEYHTVIDGTTYAYSYGTSPDTAATLGSLVTCTATTGAIGTPVDYYPTVGGASNPLGTVTSSNGYVWKLFKNSTC